MTLGQDQEKTLTLINYISSLTPLHVAVTFKSQAAIVSKISIVFAFPHVKAYVSKIDLAVKYVKVILGSSFEQTMMGWSPRWYIPNLVEISLPVLEKKIFEGFLPYMGVLLQLLRSLSVSLFSHRQKSSFLTTRLK